MLELNRKRSSFSKILTNITYCIYRFFTNVQADMVAQLSSLGVLTNEDINLFTEK